MGPIGRPNFRSRAGEGWGVVGGSRVFLMIATVIPVDPRFFCAPKKITEKFLPGNLLERMLEEKDRLSARPDRQVGAASTAEVVGDESRAREARR